MSLFRRALVALVVIATATLGLALTAGAEPSGTTNDRDLRVSHVIAAGNWHTCAIVRGGEVACWGGNWSGQLGLGDTIDRGDGVGLMGDDLPMVDLGTDRVAVSITAGASHNCVLFDDGTVKCWGSNNNGKLGLGDTDTRGDGVGLMGDDLPTVDLGTGRTVVQLTSGDDHNCAILDNGELKCWGANWSGRLGLGDTDHRGDEPDEMGDDLPAVDLGTGRTAVRITAGEDYTCALLDNGDLKCWGFNSSEGQLGLGDTESRGDDPDEMGDDLPAIDLGTGRTPVAIAGGRDGVCVILDNDDVKCWGDNGSGSLGLGDESDRGNVPEEMGDDLPAIDLGTDRRPVAINAGDVYNCVRFDDGSVKCWGRNSSGQLGLGDDLDRGDGIGLMGDDLPEVDLGETPLALSLGRRHACALFADETIRCWGSNEYGQGGIGITEARGDDPAHMGEALVPVDLSSGVRPIQVACPTAPFHGFPDVASSWAQAPVTCIKELGITNGTGGGATYSPADNVTREQMAAFLGRIWRSLDQTCPTAPFHGFPDVPATSFANADITCIKQLGITNGTGGGATYSPADAVTREQMAAFLGRIWRALGNTCPTTPFHGFADVPATSFANADITCLKALGITTGTGGGTTFSPFDAVTREQMAAFLARLIDANADATNH